MTTNIISVGIYSLLVLAVHAGYSAGVQEPLRAALDPLKYKAACPDYKSYAMGQQSVNAIAFYVRN